MIIGLDVGGTHTDVVLLGEKGLLREVKVPTDSQDLFRTILKALDQITADIEPARIQRAVLSTTLTTNTIIQKRTAPVGMIVSSGPGIDPNLFRTNEAYYAVAGCMDHRGREIHPIDPDEIRRVADQLQGAGIRQVGVVGKFSPRNPDHELAIADLLADRFDTLFLGHRISGDLNFPRRIATTFLNASVYPVHKDFFEAVQRSLREKGLTVPIRLLKPDGGNMRFESAVETPAQTILSGPAASVMGALASAPNTGVSLLLDIGGTTTDMAILIDGVPLLAPQGIQIGEYKTLIRALQTLSIGVGGDSAVRVEGGDLRVGPQRLGAPMSLGGPVPTPTDAMVVLGLSERGDRQRAATGLTPLAESLALPLHRLAEKVLDQACRQILAAAEEMVAGINRKPVYTVHELYQGSRIVPDHILVLGGPAAQFADRLKGLCHQGVHVVPRWTVANAIGAALARTTCEVVLFVDTEQEIAMAPGEDFVENISGDYGLEDAVATALTLLRAKARRRGADAANLETEIIAKQQFNMVRGFHTTGKNLRVRVQVKPGLIEGFDPVAASTPPDR
ncbi:MAG: hydantoinase/oxoprolinase family protein [Desulfosarcinaceae bacterium]|nr:hydantoinase/oxoprolinase family protein [Desulfosarcinaceae bacterium]